MSLLDNTCGEHQCAMTKEDIEDDRQSSHTNSSTCSTPPRIKSIRLEGDDYKKYEWNAFEGLIKFKEVINYSKSKAKVIQPESPLGAAPRFRTPESFLPRCVMCGLDNKQVSIPSQNKEVCKSCDSSFWYCARVQAIFKFCKGCKLFAGLKEFEGKPEASKCGKCRKRGRENYIIKKNDFLRDIGTYGENSSDDNHTSKKKQPKNSKAATAKNIATETVPTTAKLKRKIAFTVTGDRIRHSRIDEELTAPIPMGCYGTPEIDGSFIHRNDSIESRHSNGSPNFPYISTAESKSDREDYDNEQQWQWNPRTNPLMMLACVTDESCLKVAGAFR